jgi:anti-anti-sigma factor
MAQLDGDDVTNGRVERTRDTSGTTIITLVGEIDMSNAESIGDDLERFIGKGVDRCIIDLAELEFMDSAGLAMLLRATARDASITIRNPSPVMRRIIECTGLADVLRIES